MSQLQELTIIAQNTFTPPVQAAYGSDIALSISGTFVATVTPQRSLDGGVTWGDMDTVYTAPIEANLIATEGCIYRIGVKTGNFTSGSVVVKVRA